MTSGGPWDAGRIRAETAADIGFDWAAARERTPYLTAHRSPADVHGIPLVSAHPVPTQESTRDNAVAELSFALGRACWPPGTYTMALRDSRGTVFLVDRFEHR